MVQIILNLDIKIETGEMQKSKTKPVCSLIAAEKNLTNPILSNILFHGIYPCYFTPAYIDIHCLHYTCRIYIVTRWTITSKYLPENLKQRRIEKNAPHFYM